MQKITFSIIGCQHVHITIFIEEMLDMGHICAGIYEADNKELLHSIAKKYNLKIVEDVQQLLAPEVSIVGCASINNEKINIIELCAEYEKHVMVDKPLVTNKKDYDRIVEIIHENNIQIGMLLTERFRPAIHTLKERLSRGDIGEIVSIEMRKPHRLKQEERPSWHFSKEQCGGIVVDLFIHDFDLLHWLTGKKVSNISGLVSKNILPEYEDFYDVANLQVLLEDGIICNLYADWHTPNKSWTWGDCRLFIVGTEGTFELRLSGDPFITQDEIMIRVTHEEGATKVELKDPPRSITEDFLGRIQGQQSLINHDDILAATKETLNADEVANFINNLEV